MVVDISVARLALIARRDYLQDVCANFLTSLGAMDAVVTDASLRGLATFALGLSLRSGPVRTWQGLVGIALMLAPVATAYANFKRGAYLSASLAFKHTLQLSSACMLAAVLIQGRRLNLLDQLRRQKQADEARLQLL